MLEDKILNFLCWQFWHCWQDWRRPDHCDGWLPSSCHWLDVDHLWYVVDVDAGQREEVWIGQFRHKLADTEAVVVVMPPIYPVWLWICSPPPSGSKTRSSVIEHFLLRIGGRFWAWEPCSAGSFSRNTRRFLWYPSHICLHCWCQLHLCCWLQYKKYHQDEQRCPLGCHWTRNLFSFEIIMLMLLSSPPENEWK